MEHTSTTPPPRGGMSRRGLLARAGLAGAAVAAGTGLIDVGGSEQSARAALHTAVKPSDGRKFVVNDTDILQFALNTEYVETEFFLRAVAGSGLADSVTTGVIGYGAHPNAAAEPGSVTTYTPGPVPWTDDYVRQFFLEVAGQERAHFNLLRTALGKQVVARPATDLSVPFTLAMRAANVIGPTDIFDPYASQDNFLLAAYFFNDIGVTAYTGAAPYITKTANLEAAAGILGVESYHAGESRALVYAMGQTNGALLQDANNIAVLRNNTAALSGAPAVNDATITGAGGASQIVPVDSQGLAFGRGFPALLSLFYLNTVPTLSPTARRVHAGGAEQPDSLRLTDDNRYWAGPPGNGGRPWRRRSCHAKQRFPPPWRTPWWRTPCRGWPSGGGPAGGRSRPG